MVVCVVSGAALYGSRSGMSANCSGAIFNTYDSPTNSCSGLRIVIPVLKQSKLGILCLEFDRKGEITVLEHCAQPGKCDVCGVSGPVFLRCSSMGPFTFSYCERCIQSGAEPYWFTVSTVAIKGLWPDDVNEQGRRRVRSILHYLNRSEDVFKQDVYRSYHNMPIRTN